MNQVLFGGYYSTLDSALTEYNFLSGGDIWRAAIEYQIQLVSTDGVIKQFRVKLSGSPGAGKKYTFTLMLNGNPTALTFDIEDLETTGGNMVDEVTVTGGDYVAIRCVPTNSPTARYATWTSVFKGYNKYESLILSGSHEDISKTDIRYSQVMTSGSVFSATENDFRQVVPTSGTIKNFYVRLNIDPGTSPDAYRYTLRKGPAGGPQADTALTVTITANDKTGNDLVNTVDVAPGDVLTMMIEPLNTPLSAPKPAWGMTFVADTDGESIVIGGSKDGLHNTNTEYNQLTGRENWTWLNDETQRYQLGQVCTLKKLYILLSAAPGVGNKYTFTLRAAGDTNVVAEVSGAANTGNSGALEDTVANDEYMSLKVVPDDTPDAADAYWGFVCYMDPSWRGKISGVTNPAKVMGVAKLIIAEVKGVE